MNDCEKIKDFTPISKIERLQILNLSFILNISDISFLKKNKNIKELNLHYGTFSLSK